MRKISKIMFFLMVVEVAILLCIWSIAIFTANGQYHNVSLSLENLFLYVGLGLIFTFSVWAIIAAWEVLFID